VIAEEKQDLPTLTGVGVGPGDPSQITLAAIMAIQQADRVVAPSSSEEAVGRAESIVRQACPEVEIERVVIEMSAHYQLGNNPDPTPSPYSQAAARISGWLDAAESVAFVTLGDPNIYSTFTSISEGVLALRPATKVETIPGIMAFQVLASATCTTVLDANQTMTLVTALDGTSDIEEALSDSRRTVVVYKGGRHFPEIAKLAARYGRLEGSYAGELLGLPGQQICPLSEIASKPSAYLSTIIIPARRP